MVVINPFAIVRGLCHFQIIVAVKSLGIVNEN
jgi:hypothetical protein